MNKLIAITVLFLLIPLSAFGLTMMEDGQMNDITAQTGISIAVDVNLGMHVDVVAWGDSDGVGGTSNGAWVGVSDLNADLFFGLRSDIAGTLGSDGYDILPSEIEVLTIDVAQDATLYNGASFVRIGLGTFELSGDINMDFELFSWSGPGQELRTLDITNMIIRGAPGSYVDITTQGRTSGVTLNLNVLLDEIHMDALAWGDSDGTDIYNGGVGDVAGYVGLTNLNIYNLSIEGLLGIDVATAGPDFYQILADYDAAGDSAAFYAGLTYQERTMMKLALLKAYTGNSQLSDTMVVLTLGNGNGYAGIIYDAALDAYAVEADDLRIVIRNMYAASSIGANNTLLGAAEIGWTYIGFAILNIDGMVAIGVH